MLNAHTPIYQEILEKQFRYTLHIHMLYECENCRIGIFNSEHEHERISLNKNKKKRKNNVKTLKCIYGVKCSQAKITAIEKMINQ